MSRDPSVQTRYNSVKHAIEAFRTDARGRLCVEYFPISSSELAEIEHSLQYKLPAAKRAEFGDEKATKLEEVFDQLRDRKLKERLDPKRLMQLMELARLLEKDGYTVGLEDIDPHNPPELSEIDKHVLCLPEGKPLTEGSLLVIYFDIEA